MIPERRRGTLRVAAVLVVLSLCQLLWGGGNVEEKKVQREVRFAAMKTFGKSTMPELIKRFEAANPDIKVTYIEMPPPSSSTEIHQYLVSALAAGTVDVVTADAIWFAEFAEAGWLLKLDPYFSPAELGDYFEGTLKTVSYKGDLVGIPWYMDGGFLYYRKDLLEKYGEKVPVTYQDLVDTAKRILSQENNPDLQGFIWQGKKAEVLVCDLVEFLGTRGGVLDKNEQVVIDSPYGVAASQFMHDLIYKYRVSPESVITYDEEPSQRIFTAGNAIFLRNWSYVWGVSQDPAQSQVVGKVGIAPLPSVGENGSASTLGGYQYAVSSQTKDVEASIALAKFLSSPESQEFFAINMGFAPTRPSQYNNSKIKESNPFLVSLRKVFTNSVPRPVTPYYPQISLVLQAEYSKLLSDQQDVATTLANVKKDIKRIYR